MKQWEKNYLAGIILTLLVTFGLAIAIKSLAGSVSTINGFIIFQSLWSFWYYEFMFVIGVCGLGISQFLLFSMLMRMRDEEIEQKYEANYGKN